MAPDMHMVHIHSQAGKIPMHIKNTNNLMYLILYHTAISRSIFPLHWHRLGPWMPQTQESQKRHEQNKPLYKVFRLGYVITIQCELVLLLSQYYLPQHLPHNTEHMKMHVCVYVHTLSPCIYSSTWMSSTYLAFLSVGLQKEWGQLPTGSSLC